MTIEDWYDIRFDPYLTRVGRITVLWSHLELSINEAIWELANMAVGPGACITAQLIATSSRMRALVALVSYRHGDNDIIKNLNKFSETVEGLARQRNRYVHDIAHIGLDTGKVQRLEIKTEKELSFKYEATDITEMDDLFQKIKKCIDDFEILYESIIASLPPWPRTQFEQSLPDRPHPSTIPNQFDLRAVFPAAIISGVISISASGAPASRLCGATL